MLGRGEGNNSGSPVSKFKLAFAERIDPVRNDDNFQRYKIKQSRINRIIEHRYITKKKDLKDLFSKNGPHERMKKLGKLRGSHIELLSFKEREFEEIKQFKNALIEEKVHPETSMI